MEDEIFDGLFLEMEFYEYRIIWDKNCKEERHEVEYFIGRCASIYFERIVEKAKAHNLDVWLENGKMCFGGRKK